ncbi:hypothetical protein PUR61_36075 [Streptomyces sp. BE20]|uniref:bestrophin-like domain n=1 Tax=unclassified Streptomyces TaxID=2593676 RepID=UPI002E75AE37|nr:MULTISPECIES: hypothetical protein [unclassified Streptomyces]MED7952706.1 hypothetical protein [Streptomyces sp. BE303]MEE1827558.1 hypothetical protein [Streptomyces sp. BE20]
MWVNVVAVLAGAALAVVIGLGIGRVRSSPDDEGNSSAVGFVSAAVLGFFALFTGFAVAGAWQELSDARRHTYEESRALTEVYWSARLLPGPDRPVVRQRLRAYTRQVIDEEWVQLGQGHGSAEAWVSIDRVRIAADAVRTEDPVELGAKADTLRGLEDAYARRTARLADVGSRAPTLELWGLVVGAVVVLAVPPLIGLTAGGRNLVLMGFMGAAVAFAVGLVFQLSGPFDGTVKVEPAAFELALTRYEQIDVGDRGAVGPPLP